MKIIVIAGLIAVIVSLFSALYFLYRDRGHGTRMVKMLAVRVALSASLVAFLVIAYWMGWIAADRPALATEKPHPRVRLVCPENLLQPVDQHEQQQPDDVDEVPVPRGGLEGEVVVGCEVTPERSREHHRQHDRADRHVRAVESRQHEERRPVDAGRQLEVELAVRVDVFVGLEPEEREAKRDRREQPAA